jgi:hypothetical protein
MKSKKGFQLIWGILIVSAAMICLLSPNQAAGDTFVNVTIDDFTIPFGTSGNPPLQNVDPVPPPPPLVLRASQSGLSQTNVLGGARVLELVVFASASSRAVAYIDGSTDPLLRSWSVGNDPGSDSGGRIVWNGSNNLADPLGCGLPQPNTVGYCTNCTWDKFYSLKLAGVSNDQTTTWHVTLFSPGGTAAYSFLQLGNTPPTNPEILRAQFVPTAGFDFATLCRIDISVDHVDALDTTLTEATAVLDIPNPPNIHCVSPKLLGFTTNDMKQHLILPQGATFAGDLYAELSVTNTAPASPTQVVIEDVLPAGMTFQGDVNVVSPPGFILGPDPVIGSGGTISWTSTSLLGVDETLTFTFKVHLVMNAPGTLTNSFHAKALGLDFPADVCQGDVTLQNPPGKVPSLSEWSVIILSLLLAASAIWLLRKRRVS